MREGKHIKVQVYGVAFDKLKDAALVEKFLLDIVYAAGMRELGKPHVYDIRDTLTLMGLQPDEDEPEGVTGIVVLSTSHVAIHTWPHRGYAVMDLFSCRDFENDDPISIVNEQLGPARVRIHDLSFSLEVPEAPSPET